MPRPIFAVFALTLSALASSCQSADPATPRGQFAAQLDGTKLSIAMNGMNGSSDLRPQVAAINVSSSEVIFSTSTPQGVFFVIDFLGPSPVSGQGDCENGVEENLVWVAFDPSLRPINVSSALIGSCQQMVVPDQGIQQNSKSIFVRYNSYSEHVRRILYFRKTAPQLGFTVQLAPFEPAPDDSAPPQ